MNQFEEIRQRQRLVADQILKGIVGGEELIEKAHNVGDVHPNGKWVWTQLPSGKYDWRVRKTDAQPQQKKDEAGGKMGIPGVSKIVDGFKVQRSEYSDLSKMSLEKTPKGNWRLYYDGKDTGTTMGADVISDANAKKAGLLKEEADSVSDKWETDEWEFSGDKITKQQFDDILKYRNSTADAHQKDSVSYADLKPGETYTISQIRELLPDTGDDGKKLDRMEAKFDRKYGDDEVAKQFVQGCYPMRSYLSSKSDASLNVQKIGDLKEKVNSSNISDRMHAKHYEVVEVTLDVTIKSKTVKVKRVLSIDKSLSWKQINSFM